jgi:hypothetical protein
MYYYTDLLPANTMVIRTMRVAPGVMLGYAAVPCVYIFYFFFNCVLVLPIT